MEAEILHKHLNRKGGFLIYPIGPETQERTGEMEVQRHTDSISKALSLVPHQDHLLLMGLEFSRGWTFFSITTCHHPRHP